MLRASAAADGQKKLLYIAFCCELLANKHSELSIGHLRAFVCAAFAKKKGVHTQHHPLCTAPHSQVPIRTEDRDGTVISG